MTLRVLVADDEAIARARLVRLLPEVEGVEVAGECEDVDGVLARVRDGDLDLVLLDVQMPGLSGIDAMALLPDDGPQIVLCTAHAEYAVKAFDEGATDYLLKPVELDRLRKAIERVRARHAALIAPAPERPRRELTRLALPTKQGVVLIDPASVTHAVLDGVLVTVHGDQGPWVTDFSLQELERKLGGAFLRVHRRALLNLERVARLEPQDTGGYLARTDSGASVEVSRQCARDLRKWLGLRRGPSDEE